MEKTKENADLVTYYRVYDSRRFEVFANKSQSLCRLFISLFGDQYGKITLRKVVYLSTGVVLSNTPVRLNTHKIKL